MTWYFATSPSLDPWLSQEWLDLTANRLAPAPLPALTSDDALLIIAT